MKHLTPSALAAIFTLVILSLMHDARAEVNPHPVPGVPLAQQNLPPPPAGMRPMRVPDPVRSEVDPQSSDGFACFGACGPSCSCVGRVDGTATSEHQGKTCAWTTITCRTQSFCAWHDTCYNRCDFNFPGYVTDGSVRRPLCYRACDVACATGADPTPVGGWEPASLDPGTPPQTPGVKACLSGVSDPNDAPYDGTITFAELVSCK